MSEFFIKECLSDMWTIHLALIGIDLSIMTLLYSFILNKKDELKLTTERIKLGNKDPLCLQRQKFAIKYIQRMNNINVKCFFILLVLLILTAGSWLGWRILGGLLCKWDFIVVGISTFLILVYTLYLVVCIIKQYRNDTKI